MKLEDSCNPPASITNPTGLTDQTYMLTDPNHPQYTPADFVVSPSYCDIKYEVTVTPFKNFDDADTSAVQPSGDKTFDFEYSTDDSPITHPDEG